jgi:hypothetical protein
MGKLNFVFNLKNWKKKKKKKAPTWSICYDYIIMNLFPLLKKEQKGKFLKKERCWSSRKNYDFFVFSFKGVERIGRKKVWRVLKKFDSETINELIKLTEKTSFGFLLNRKAECHM